MATDYLQALGGIQNIGGALPAIQQAEQNDAQTALTQQQGASLSQETQQRQAAFEAWKQDQARQQARQQAEAQAVQSFIKNPTAQGAAALSVQFPEHAAPIKQAWEMQNGATQDSDRQGLALIYSSLANGRPDLAQSYLEQRQAAAKAAGKPEPMTDTLLDAVKSGKPDQAKGIAAYILSSIPGGDDFAKTLSTVTKGDGSDSSTVVGPGGALVNKTTGAVLYRSDPSAKDQYVQVRNADGTTSYKPLPGTPAAGGDAPRSVRNNNPGNIEDSAFARSQPGYVGSDGRFAQFDSPEAGAQAQMALLGSYGAKGLNTVGKIVSKWAPAGDGNNNPAAYAATVAKQMGVTPSTPLDMTDPATLRGLQSAMAQVEGGPQSASNGPRNVVSGDSGSGPIPGDPTKSGPEYIASLPPGLANRVQGILDGKLPYPPQSRKESQPILNAISQADPTFDATTWKRRNDTVHAYTPAGQVGQQVISLKTAINHLYDLAEASEDLGGVSWKTGNRIGNYFAGEASSKKLAAYNAALTPVTFEVPKALGGKAPAEGEVDQVRSDFSPNNGPDARKTQITKTIELFQGRLQPLLDAYQAQMGKSFNIDKELPGEAVAAKVAALENWANGGKLEVPSRTLGTHAQQPARPAAIPPGAVYIGKSQGRPIYRVNGKNWTP